MMLHFISVIAILAPTLVAAEWRGFPEIPEIPEIPENNSSRSGFTTRQGIRVTLYDHSNYEGDRKEVTLGGGCTNVLDFNDRASSVRVSEGCVRLWEHVDCEGRLVDIQAPGESHLPNRDFNDETISVSPCNFRSSGNCFNEQPEIVNYLNGANDLAEHAENLRRMMLDWFPFIQGQLYTPAYKPVPRIEVHYDVQDRGIFAMGREIHIPQGYARNNKGDTGVYIHEMTHVIHQARRCPGWAVEGTAEYMRRWFYEPKTTPTKPTNENMDNDYLGDWLIYYLTTITKRPIVYLITKACQEGSWRDGFIREMTGKDEKEWWKQMVRDNDFPWKRVR